MNLETDIGPALPYCPYYIYQMMIAGGCTLLKLCKSFFAAHIDMDYTKSLFNRTIWTIRGVSVSSGRQGDLPQRLAEVLVQIWRLGGTPLEKSSITNNDFDNTLMLKVRCRLSMSLLYDLVWRWREDARTSGRNLEGWFTGIFPEKKSLTPPPVYLNNPTNPDSAGESSANSSVGPIGPIGPMRTAPLTSGVSSGGDPSLAPAPALPQVSLGIEAPTNGTGSLPSSILEPNYEVFDPLNWLLDGLVDLPYSYSSMPGMEAQGVV